MKKNENEPVYYALISSGFDPIKENFVFYELAKLPLKVSVAYIEIGERGEDVPIYRVIFWIKNPTEGNKKELKEFLEIMGVYSVEHSLYRL